MTLLGKFFAWVKKTYDSLGYKTKKLVPIAIDAVEALKVIMDSPVDDVLAFVIKSATAGKLDPAIVDKVDTTIKEWIPKVLFELNLIESIANITDQNAQLQAILAQLKLSSNETKNILYHGLSSLILEKLSDGNISWSDATAISEYYYNNFIKK